MRRLALIMFIACFAIGGVSLTGCQKTVDKNMAVSFDK